MVDGVGTTHNVKIGDYHYLIRPGSYRKVPAPIMGARFSTGDPDYNNLSKWQHWAQTCWIGGFGAERWEDEAMYDEVAGVDTTMHDVLVLTRDLSADTGSPSTQEVREFIEYRESLYAVCHGVTAGQVARVFQYTSGTDSWAVIKTFATIAKCAAVFAGYLVVGEGGATMSYMNSAGVWSSFAKPGGETGVPDAMRVFKGQLYVAFDREVWRLNPDLTWDGSTVFYTAEAGARAFVSMEPHLGFLYMATLDGRIVRTDGNNTFEMWDFDAGIAVDSIRGFDGRLFIACREPLLGTTAQQATLYQFSGAAVTELKRWGLPLRDLSAGRMRVINGRLFYGAPSLLGMGNGFGVAVYDPAEDSHHMWATNKDTVAYAGSTDGVRWLIDDVDLHERPRPRHLLRRVRVPRRHP
jgi:hypothetical protein